MKNNLVFKEITQLLQLTRDIISSFEKAEYTLGIFIDLSEAFHTVDRQILIKKLL